MANKSFLSKSLNVIKDWGVTIISIITFVWTCTQLMTGKDESINVTKWLIIGGVALFLILIISVWKNCPKKKCYTEFFPGSGNTKIKIIIQKGSVLKQSGKKVIHVQDTFETDINKCKETSLLHAFLSSITVDKKALDNVIDSSLKKNGYTANTVSNSLYYQLRGAYMKTSRYDIGAVAEYNDYFLVAFSNICDDQGNVEEKDYSQYEDSVNKAFVGLRDTHKGQVIDTTYNVGIWGFRFNGRMYDPRLRIETMVRSFIRNSRQKPFCNTLRICLNREHANKIDFNQMQILLDYFVETTI